MSGICQSSVKCFFYSSLIITFSCPGFVYMARLESDHSAFLHSNGFAPQLHEPTGLVLATYDGLSSSPPKGFLPTDCGLFIPGANRNHIGETLAARSEVRPPINFIERAIKRPVEYEDYLKKGPDGEKRFDFDGENHKKVLAYINGNGKEAGEEGYIPDSYTTFQVKPEATLAHLVEEGETIADVQKRLWESKHLPSDGEAILLPNAHHVPNIGEGHYSGDFFYWDNLWSVMFASMRNDPEFIKGVIDNFKLEYRFLKFIPNSDKLKIANRSQPPVGALMLREADKVMPDTAQNRDWRKDTVAFLKSEYFTTWAPDPEAAEKYDTYPGSKKGVSNIGKWQIGLPDGTSRYVGADVPGDEYSAMAASGEDNNPRFMRKTVRADGKVEYRSETASFIPTDLMGLKATYKKLFAEEALKAGNEEEFAYWEKRLQKSYDFVNMQMWDEEKGWYMDWNHVDQGHSEAMALAAFLILLAGLAPKDRANRMVANLHKFTLPYGLAVTTGEEGLEMRKGEQWKFPNVWSPREDFVLEYLMQDPKNHPLAEELIIRSQIGKAEFCAENQTMPEVLNGVTGDLGEGSFYSRKKHHKGFLWTNVVYLKDEERLRIIYAMRDEKAKIPHQKLREVPLFKA